LFYALKDLLTALLGSVTITSRTGDEKAPGSTPSRGAVR